MTGYSRYPRPVLWCWSLALLATLALMTGCRANPPPASVGLGEPGPNGPFDLAIHSYNYTDHYIDSFYVNGVWGGNVRVSKATSGGGGGACCVRWYPLLPPPKKYTVRWVADACKHQVEVGGGVFDNYKQHWKEQEVTLTTPVPARPEYFEVHFYKDGHVEVAITDVYSPPRLKLPVDERGRRPGVPDWPQCTAEQMRTYVD
ncbi:DUF3304 domain-containing protein [Lysobacter cavernae]|uniref:DUF3304 domain-containing protein n=1 Tax=Lysobacter cavernae TaxID=1685901 RepID=A0ABV7RR66_9GAMM